MDESQRRASSWRAIAAQWPLWLKVTVPLLTAVLVGVLAVIIVPTIPSAESRSTSDTQRAEQLCNQYARDRDVHLPLTSYQRVDLTALRVLANQMKVDISPWDRFDPEHFIASCSFGPDLSNINTTTPTTVCPNGQRVILSKQLHIYFDGKGHSGPDPLDNLPSSLTPCSNIGKAH